MTYSYHKLTLDLSLIFKNKQFMYQKGAAEWVFPGVQFPYKEKASALSFVFFCTLSAALSNHGNNMRWLLAMATISALYRESSTLINQINCIKELLHGCVAFRNVHSIHNRSSITVVTLKKSRYVSKWCLQRLKWYLLTHDSSNGYILIA